MRNTYKKIRKNAKYKHKVNEGKKLNQIAKTQPGKFWISLKRCYNTKAKSESSIEINELFQHFSTLLGENVENINNNNNQQFADISDRQLDAEISLEEIRKAVFHQKKSKDQIA